MAITLRTAGTWVAANATTQVVTLPTHQTGDMLIVRVGMKHATLPGDITCGTAGWARIGQFNNGTTASGNGSGDVQVATFWKIATSGTETNPTITFHASVAATPSCAVAMAYQKAAADVWETPLGAGGGIAAATSYSATMGSHISATTGDVLDSYAVTNDNTTLTVPTVAQAGLTLDTVTESPAAALSSGTSNDISADGCYRTATAGTSSAAAVASGTNSVADVGAAWVTRLRVTGITGTGALTLPTPDIGGTGILNPSGTGALTLPTPDVAGVGAETLTGVGALTLPTVDVAGTGTHTLEHTGTGALTLKAPTVVGTGILHPSGTGALTLPTPDIAGVGAETIAGTGALTLPTPDVAGTGVLHPSGTGALTLRVPTLDGSGLVTITGSGALTLPTPDVAGVGIMHPAGVGVLTLRAPSIIGTGTHSAGGAVSGTGALTLPVPAVAGVGTHTAPAGGEVRHRWRSPFGIDRQPLDDEEVIIVITSTGYELFGG